MSDERKALACENAAKLLPVLDVLCEYKMERYMDTLALLASVYLYMCSTPETIEANTESFLTHTRVMALQTYKIFEDNIEEKGLLGIKSRSSGKMP